MRLRPFFRRFRSDFFVWARAVVVTVLAIGIVGGSAWAVYAEAWPALVAHSYFRLRSVKVVCDSAAGEPTALAARAGLYDGTSLWQIDPDDGRSALESVPWVRDVRIERQFPDQVSVQVYRREAVAATVVEDGTFLIDGDGVVYREGEAAPLVDLPYLTGWNASESRAERVTQLRTQMALIDAVEAAGIAVSQVDVDADGVFRVYPENRRIVIVLGREPAVETVLARLQAVWPALPEGADLREIDLSYTDRAVLRTAPGRMRAVISAMAGETGVATAPGGAQATAGGRPTAGDGVTRAQEAEEGRRG
jgi:cell division septal protein FtsQ